MRDLRAALATWNSRSPRRAPDLAFAVYAGALVAIIAVAPSVRALWLAITSEVGAALLLSPHAPRATVAVVAALWAGAFLIGRERGPALRPPLLTHVLGRSGFSRARVYGGPVARAAAITTAATSSAAALIALSLAARGSLSPAHAGEFMVAGACVGIITALSWLAGQVLPRLGVVGALGICTIGAATLTVPWLGALTPMGWVGFLYPADILSEGGAVPATQTPIMLALLITVAIIGIALTPALLNSLEYPALALHAARWESASMHAFTMDFGAAFSTYQRVPTHGRRVRAIRPMKTLTGTFFIRDAVASIRTPGRLLSGLTGIAAASTVFVLALRAVHSEPSLPVASEALSSMAAIAEDAGGGLAGVAGAAAGVALFLGLGPLTDGFRHAAAIASGPPLYGVSDRRLCAMHLTYPTVIAFVTVAMAALITLITIGAGAASGTAFDAIITTRVSTQVGALCLSILALRVSETLRGPLPPALLAPIPSPVGDLSILVQLTWTLGGVLLAAAAGVASVMLFELPLGYFAVAAVIGMTCARRWRTRR